MITIFCILWRHNCVPVPLSLPHNHSLADISVDVFYLFSDFLLVQVFLWDLSCPAPWNINVDGIGEGEAWQSSIV